MKIAVLLTIYNRPEYAAKAFAAIRIASPSQLFIAADGPAPGNQNDPNLCAKAREACGRVDWNCDVRRLYRDENLGCKSAMIGAIDWFFDCVEEGIIVEEDCVPTTSFFAYCNALLNLYRSNRDIMMISGSNPAINIDIEYDYCFSRFYHIWGWATWKRAWKQFDLELSDWPEFRRSNLLDQLFQDSPQYREFLVRMFDRIHGSDPSVWGVQWGYSCLINQGLAILPKQNLVGNIGFYGTHEMTYAQLCLKTEDIDVSQIRHPPKIEVDAKMDELIFEATGLVDLK